MNFHSRVKYIWGRPRKKENMDMYNLETANAQIEDYMIGGSAQKQEVLGFLTKETDEFTLNNYDGAPVAVVRGDQPSDSYFVYALAIHYLEHTDSPLDLIDIIVASANSMPDKDSRNIEVVRELEDYLRMKYVRGENVSRDYFFLKRDFIICMGNRQMTSRGAAIKSIIEGMSSTSANDWLYQGYGSLDFMNRLLQGEFNDSLYAIGMTKEEVTSVIKETASVIKGHMSLLLRSDSLREQSPKWQEENQKVMKTISKIIPK